MFLTIIYYICSKYTHQDFAPETIAMSISFSNFAEHNEQLTIDKSQFIIHNS